MSNKAKCALARWASLVFFGACLLVLMAPLKFWRVAVAAIAAGAMMAIFEEIGQSEGRDVERSKRKSP